MPAAAYAVRRERYATSRLLMTCNLSVAHHMQPFGCALPDDEVVELQPLSREQLAKIVDLQLRRLRERLAERGIGIVPAAA